MLRVAGWMLSVLLVLLVLAAISLLLPPVQRVVVQRLAVGLSERLGAEVKVGDIAVHPFGRIRLGDIFVGDLRGDTLFVVEQLTVDGLRIHPGRHLVKASSLELHGARFALATAAEDAHSNLTNLLDKLAGGPSDSTGAAWAVAVSSFHITGLHFSFHDAHYPAIPFGVDFDHVEVKEGIVKGHQFKMAGDSIAAHLERLALREQSGFVIEELAGATVVSGSGIRVEHMQLRTPGSHVRGQLRFQSEGWTDYSDFTEKVLMRLELDSSRLNFRDIAYFAPDLEGIDLPIGIRGRIRGTVSALKGRDMRVDFGARSHFIGNAELNGLPAIENTFMLLDIAEMRTRYQDLETIPIPPFTKGERLQLPNELKALGAMSFTGNFTGFLGAFTAYGQTTTDLGSLRTDLSYQRDERTGVFTLSGRAATDALVLGPLLSAPAIGAVAADIRLKGSGKSLAGMQAELEGSVPLFTVNGTRIQGVKVNGRIERDLFKGDLSVDDEHLVLDFTGLADLRGKWPVVDFHALLQHADLAALGILTNENYSTVSLAVSARGTLAPDSLKGELSISDISYCNTDGEHALGNILLTSGRADGENLLELRSTFADADVRGTFLPTRLPGALTSIVYSVFPSLRSAVNFAQAEQRFRFTVTTKETAAVLGLFVPGLELDRGGVFQGSLDSRSFGLGFGAKLPGVRYGQFRAQEVDLLLDKALDILAFRVYSGRQTWQDSIWFQGTSITGKAYQDDLEFSMGWDASSGGTHGELDVLGEVRGLGAVTFDLLPSTLHLGRGNWQNPRPARIRVDSSTVQVTDLILENEEQRIRLDGAVSRDPGLPMAFSLENVSLENLTPFLRGPVLKGVLDAQGELLDLYVAPLVLSDIEVRGASVQDKPIGDLHFSAEWADGQRSIALEGDVVRGTVKALDFRGQLSLEQGNPVDLDLLMDRFDLAFIDPYLPEGISDIQGQVTGTLRMTGPLADLEVNGELDLKDAGLRIDYLNTLYKFSHRVKVRPDMFALDFVTVRDEEGNTARLGATILHNGLKDWNYNAWGTMDRFLVMNTTLKENGLYYGKAYATGDLEVSGSAGRMEITVDARTAPGTDIHFPIGGSTEVSPIGFVRFAAGDTLDGEAPVMDLSGIALDMKVEVTPDALFELIFDPTVGDILSGRGRGNMEMSVNPSGEFDMRGQVEVSDGEYLFTLRNVINKRFQLQPGGRIVWYGDPFDAYLDLAAIYRVRAPLYDIMFEKNEAYRRRVPVDVVMNLRDKLMNPEIQFNVRLPSVDESIRTQVNSVLSTEQEMNRQVFALIVLNRFVQPPAYNTGQGSPGGSGALTGAGTSTSELLSNQVSNWLSKLSSDLDLGVSYRPGDNITQDELELAMSTQLFDERLLVSTNVGVQYGARSTANGNTLVGDFQLEYLITNDGKLRLKAFSVSNDRNLDRADQSLTTQGAGVAYREEFDDLGELWQKLLNIFRSAEKDRTFTR